MLRLFNPLKQLVACSVLFLSVSVSVVSPNVSAGSCCGCERCAYSAIQTAKANSIIAFRALQASILQLGLVFQASSLSTATAIRASASNITTELNKSHQVEKQMLDAMNGQQEARSQQMATMSRKRELEETFPTESVARNIQVAFATQDEFQSSDYQQFLHTHRDTYLDLLKAERSALLDQFVLDPKVFKGSEKLLWDGDIGSAEEAAQVIFLTQQVLYGGQEDPFAIDPNAFDNSSSRDDQALASAKIIWGQRIQPAIDFFAFDQGLRTRPTDEMPSVLGWLEENINDGLYSAEGVTDTYANSTKSDLLEMIALDQKRLNLIRYFNFTLGQINERIVSSRSALLLEKEGAELRNAANLFDR